MAPISESMSPVPNCITLRSKVIAVFLGWPFSYKLLTSYTMIVYYYHMKTSTVNIAFKDDLLKEIDDIAQKESRSRSELIREAARMYIDKKKNWESIFQFGQRHSEDIGLTEKDIAKEINAYRRQK